MSDLAEKAVRDYLNYLVDPNSFEVDTSEIDARIEAEEDVLVKLKLYSERLAALDVGGNLRAGFIEHALTWSKANDVNAEAFIQAGVPRTLLEEAKLLARTKSRSSKRTNRKRSSVEKLLKEKYTSGTLVTIEDMVKDSGCSKGYIYSSIRRFKDEGVLKDAGEAPRTCEYGRAPKLYQVIRSK